MSRKLDNWLEAYQRYTLETESSPIFHKWVGISMVASALRKKVHLGLGRLKIYPNLYVVLVAEPGIARKTQAINFGLDIVHQIPAIITSADSVTVQQLLVDIEQAACDEAMPDCTTFRHASLSIISKEFETFLGQKGDNVKMLVTLTDLFDGSETPWKHRTKHSGQTSIPSVFLTLLGATTPDSLASCLPPSAIGGGLTSRILFVWSTMKTKKVPIPQETEEILQLRSDLIHDLSVISRIAGKYKMTQECEKKYIEWYMNYDETSKHRLCSDPAFNGWYSRKPLFIMKLSQIFTAIRNSSLLIEWSAYEEAALAVEEVERAMGKTFTSIGKSEIAQEVDLVRSLISQHKIIAEKKLLHMVWRDMDSQKFDNVIKTIIRSGYCERVYKGPNDERGIFYKVTN